MARHDWLDAGLLGPIANGWDRLRQRYADDRRVSILGAAVLLTVGVALIALFVGTANRGVLDRHHTLATAALTADELAGPSVDAEAWSAVVARVADELGLDGAGEDDQLLGAIGEDGGRWIVVGREALGTRGGHTCATVLGDRAVVIEDGFVVFDGDEPVSKERASQPAMVDLLDELGTEFGACPTPR